MKYRHTDSLALVRMSTQQKLSSVAQPQVHDSVSIHFHHTSQTSDNTPMFALPRVERRGRRARGAAEGGDVMALESSDDSEAGDGSVRLAFRIV